MFFNIELDENRQLRTPVGMLTGQHPYGLAVISLRCSIEDELDDYEILALKTNLITYTAHNRQKIVSYITGRKKSRFITFVPPYPIAYKMDTRNLANGTFTLYKIRNGEEIVMTTAALTVRIFERL